MKLTQEQLASIKDNPVLAGKIVETLRTKYGHTYDRIKDMFFRLYDVDGDTFEELMMEADRLESLE